MKTPGQLIADIERRLMRTWAATLAGVHQQPTPAWPHAFALGQPTQTELEADFGPSASQAGNWRTWAAEHDVRLQVRDRRVHGTSQDMPTHLHVPDIDTAARLCGGMWPARVARARHRAALLFNGHPHLANPARMLASVDAMTEGDFGLLCRAADWFRQHDASGLTPRQVPIEGLHAKWLNTRHSLVRELAGIEDLRLLPPHPARIHFTYLDPAYRAGEGRIHDSATVGDRVVLPYEPQVVVISENKDTAIGFPQLAGGVSIEGVGRGGGTAASFDWIVNAKAVFYWGDMDADGLEILDGFRSAGVAAGSILMDTTAYQRWRQFGTDVDQRGVPLRPRHARPVPNLTAEEAGLYYQLVSEQWSGPRRIEQERIPLTEAVRVLEAQM